MTKITDLTAYSTPALTDVLPIVDVVNDTTKKIQVQNLVPAASISSSKVDFGGSGAGIWWEEVGRTTLAVAGDTISITPIVAKKYLKIYAAVTATGGTLNARLRFNNDTAANYVDRVSINNGADATAGSQTSMGVSAAVSSTPLNFEGEVKNVSSIEKTVMGRSIDSGTAGAANLTSRMEIASKWANTSAQITRVDLINLGTGDFAIGSELIILGHN